MDGRLSRTRLNVGDDGQRSVLSLPGEKLLVTEPSCP
jgi:hypothetical protein